MLRESLGLMLFAVACNSNPSTAPVPSGPAAAQPAPREPAREDPAGSPAATAAVPVASAPTLAAGAWSVCVEGCIARRQMQAVAPQQIEADCRAECEKK